MKIDVIESLVMADGYLVSFRLMGMQYLHRRGAYLLSHPRRLIGPKVS